MKVVFESYLLYFVTRIYKATTLYKNCRKLFDRKYLMENVNNTIFEPLDFKLFWGRMAPDPTLQTRDPGARVQGPPPPSPQLKIGSTVPASHSETMRIPVVVHLNLIFKLRFACSSLSRNFKKFRRFKK